MDTPLPPVDSTRVTIRGMTPHCMSSCCTGDVDRIRRIRLKLQEWATKLDEKAEELEAKSSGKQAEEIARWVDRFMFALVLWLVWIDLSGIMDWVRHPTLWGVVW